MIRQEFIMTPDGLPSPIAHGSNKRVTITICANCKQLAKRLKKGKCDNCYNYERFTGNPRPEYLYRDRATCNNHNCGRVLATDPHHRRYYCNACYKYKLKRGVMRPERLCKRGRQNEH
jgi:hypothetical protein